MADTTLVDELRTDPAGIGYAGKTVDEITSAGLDSRQIPNPNPREYVPRRPSESDLSPAMEALSSESMARLVATPIFQDFIDSVKASDRDAVLRLIVAGQRSGAITADEYTFLITYFGGQILDPDWQPTITAPPRWAELGIQSISRAEVVAAIEAAGLEVIQ